jgi:hypothetical protein
MIVVLGVALASAASADVIIKMKETTDLAQKKPKVGVGSMMIGADRLAIRWDDPSLEGHGSFIYRADKELIWLLDNHKKTYQQVDKAFVDQMASQVTSASTDLTAQLQQMKPDERKKAEDMMKGVQAAAGTLKPEYRKTGETKVIDGHTCSKVDTYWGGDLASHAWVAPYSDWNLTEKDAAVFQSMGDFVSKMAGSLATREKNDYIPMHELGGVPLLSQDVEGGKVTRETVVESITRAASPAGSFEIPAGYKVQTLPSMERHGTKDR